MSQTELLTAEQERHLARTIEAGVLAEHLLATGEPPVAASMTELNILAAEGRRAWEHFWLANVRLVWMLAGAEAARSRLGVDELFQEGCVALAGAMQRFDPNKGRFSTYAVPRVRQHLAEVAATRFGEWALPVSRAIRVRQLRGMLSRLDQQHGREAGAAELSAELGRPAAWVSAVLSHRRPVPLEVIGDQREADGSEQAESRVFAAQVQELLDRVPSTEAQVLRLRYGLGDGEQCSVAAVAQRLRVSVSTVRRVEARGLSRLRRVFTEPVSQVG